MGFWHTGYFEFHEEHELGPFADPAAPTFSCGDCGAIFLTEADLNVHRFEGHATPRPILLFRGRECGRSRLVVTEPSSPDDWEIMHAEQMLVNGDEVTPAAAIDRLISAKFGVMVVVLRYGDREQEFQFDFALAEEDDLRGVDAALTRLIDSREWGLGAIDGLIQRGKPFRTAKRYLNGLASYLYGVHDREHPDASDTEAEPRYQSRYDAAVRMLGDFDRPAAEAICGLVAFHYNQFPRAMAKTRSPRIAETALRLNALLDGRSSFRRSDLRATGHLGLDRALSDSVVERVLDWSALPLDGSAKSEVSEIVAGLDAQRPYDQLKLRLIVAEHLLASGDVKAATRAADALRQSRATENWYPGFRRRIADGGTK